MKFISQANRNQQNAMSVFTLSYHMNCKVILTSAFSFGKQKVGYYKT